MEPGVEAGHTDLVHMTVPLCHLSYFNADWKTEDLLKVTRESLVGRKKEAA